MKIKQNFVFLFTLAISIFTLQGLSQDAVKNDQTLIKPNQEMDNLEVLIQKQHDEYIKRPKRKFIGSNIKNEHYAKYVKSWEERIAVVGNLNYPKIAIEKKLYGVLKVSVSIQSNGSLKYIEIQQSTGYKELDEAAVEIIKMAAPYDEFDEYMRKETDILTVTRNMTFAHSKLQF